MEKWRVSQGRIEISGTKSHRIAHSCRRSVSIGYTPGERRGISSSNNEEYNIWRWNIHPDVGLRVQSIF